MKVAKSLVLVALCLACGIARADTITVAPANPTTGDAISIRVDGVSGVSPSFAISSAVSVSGSSIRLYGCTNYTGFATGSSYFILYSLSSLSAATYVVEYFHGYCASDGTLLVPYQLTVSQVLAVSGAAAAAAIPALNTYALVMLIISTIAVAALVLKRAR